MSEAVKLFKCGWNTVYRAIASPLPYAGWHVYRANQAPPLPAGETAAGVTATAIATADVAENTDSARPGVGNQGAASAQQSQQQPPP
jgi:hypothetical protein